MLVSGARPFQSFQHKYEVEKKADTSTLASLAQLVSGTPSRKHLVDREIGLVRVVPGSCEP